MFSRLKKNEAVIVMQDILFNFTGKYLDSFVLSKSSDGDTVGYKLCIKGTIDDLSIQKIRRISEEYNLIVKEENGLVIYEPAARQ